MEKKKSLLVTLIGVILILTCLNTNYLLGDQNGYIVKIKNGDTITIGLNETATIKNIWKDESLENWYIKIKILAIEETGVKAIITSTTFIEKIYDKTTSIKTGETISIIQALEVTTDIRLEKILTDKAIFSLNIQVAPPAPELSQWFNVEIK